MSQNHHDDIIKKYNCMLAYRYLSSAESLSGMEKTEKQWENH